MMLSNFLNVAGNELLVCYEMTQMEDDNNKFLMLRISDLSFWEIRKIKKTCKDPENFLNGGLT